MLRHAVTPFSAALFTLLFRLRFLMLLFQRAPHCRFQLPYSPMPPYSLTARHAILRRLPSQPDASFEAAAFAAFMLSIDALEIYTIRI